MEVRLSQAGAATGTLWLKNRSGKPLLISATAYDWDMSINGTSAFFAPAARKDSCAGWIVLNPRKFKVESAKQQMVSFIVTPPDVERGEYRGALIFNAQAAVRDRNDPTGLSGNVAVALYCNFPGVQRQGRILKAESHYNAVQKTIESLLEVESTGTAHIRFRGSFAVREENGKTVGLGGYDGNVVFPGRKLLLHGLCQRKLVPGKYVTESVLKFQAPLYAAGRNGLAEYGDGLTQLEAVSEFEVKQGE